jgi:excinuclease ABC subunit B
MPRFNLQSKYKTSPAQEDVINTLVKGIENNTSHQTLVGVTGSGKTFVMANMVQRLQRPTLVLAHNKTLAAQLFSEFKDFFPENEVKYFVSYYDYYQPEAYIPQRDLYIEKESEINKTIEKYRNAATQALLTRPDTLIVASVSCIYGLGNPENYDDMSRVVEVGKKYNREKLTRHLSDMQYERTQMDFSSGTFRVRGDVVEVYLTSGDTAVKIEYFGDEIEGVKLINPLTGEVLSKPNSYKIFPAKHFVTPYESVKEVIPTIKKDMEEEVATFKKKGKIIEAYRLEQRVKFDIEMMSETGFCTGIENYSRYLDGRAPGTHPSTLLDYFPDDYLMFIDESHITVPQVRGMYNGDKMRKETLINYGFRLQAALDNRPLQFNEFSSKLDKVVYTSATPNEYELDLSKAAAQKSLDPSYSGRTELLIRPTGLVDPMIDVRPITLEGFDSLKTAVLKNGYKDMTISKLDKWKKTQVDDLIIEVQANIKKGQRVLVTTLTKRMSEDLSSYLLDLGLKVTYIHSELDAIKRVEILRSLRQGKYDCVIGINLLREGLDLPEVSLVAILDADKEGFLRSKTSLVQTIGRAARHSEGRVIMYADKITDSMKYAIDETERRRNVQIQYNKDNNITPKSIIKEIKDNLPEFAQEEGESRGEKTLANFTKQSESFNILIPNAKKVLLKEIEVQMEIYSDMLEFEKAAECRDLLNQLKKQL